MSESFEVSEQRSVDAVRQHSADVAELVELRGRVCRAVKLLMTDPVDPRRVLAELTGTDHER